LRHAVRHNINSESLLLRFLPTAVPLTLALPLHGVSIATVAVQVKLNEPSSLNVAVLASVSALMTSVKEYVDNVLPELQVSTSPTANGPADGVIVTSGGQTVQKGAHLITGLLVVKINSPTNQSKNQPRIVPEVNNSSREYVKAMWIVATSAYAFPYNDF